MDFVKEWLPYVISLAVSAGLFTWLRQKVSESKLSKNATIEAMLDQVFISAICFVEKKVQKAAASGGEESSSKAKQALAAALAANLAKAKGITIPDGTDVGSRIEAAWGAIRDADFTVTPVADSSTSVSDTQPTPDQ